jgi:hypothetical protein
VSLFAHRPKTGESLEPSIFSVEHFLPSLADHHICLHCRKSLARTCKHNLSLHSISRMGKKRVLCCYGVDIDAVAGWLGSYGGEDSTSDISRGTKMVLTSSFKLNLYSLCQ